MKTSRSSKPWARSARVQRSEATAGAGARLFSRGRECNTVIKEMQVSGGHYLLPCSPSRASYCQQTLCPIPAPLCPMHALDESSWRVWACVPRPGPTELLQLSGPERRLPRRRPDFGQSHNQVGILTADLWRDVKPPLRNPSDRSSDSLPEESAGPHFHCVSARQGMGEPRLGDMHGGRVGNRSKHSLPRAHLPCRGGRQILQPQRA